jgi:hypothetical protein
VQARRNARRLAQPHVLWSGMNVATCDEAMRWSAGLIVAFVLWGCSDSRTNKPAVDASDAIVEPDGAPDNAKPDGPTDVEPATDLAPVADVGPAGQDGRADTPAVTKDAPADRLAPDAEDQPDVPAIPSDGAIDLPAEPVDGHQDGPTGQTDGSTDGVVAGLDGGAGCSSLGPCECLESSGCAPIAEACWCPTECGMVCTCGGGRFVGCVPRGLSTCESASERVAKLCPDIAVPVTNLCASSSSECIAKCLDEVTSCSDLECALCSTCSGCDDTFSRCYQDCWLMMRG